MSEGDSSREKKVTVEILKDDWYLSYPSSYDEFRRGDLLFHAHEGDQRVLVRVSDENVMVVSEDRVTVNTELTATRFLGDGSNLTDIQFSNIKKRFNYYYYYCC